MFNDVTAVSLLTPRAPVTEAQLDQSTVTPPSNGHTWHFAPGKHDLRGFLIFQSLTLELLDGSPLKLTQPFTRLHS